MLNCGADKTAAPLNTLTVGDIWQCYAKLLYLSLSSRKEPGVRPVKFSKIASTSFRQLRSALWLRRIQPNPLPGGLPPSVGCCLDDPSGEGGPSPDVAADRLRPWCLCEVDSRFPLGVPVPLPRLSLNLLSRRPPSASRSPRSENWFGGLPLTASSQPVLPRPLPECLRCAAAGFTQ